MQFNVAEAEHVTIPVVPRCKRRSAHSINFRVSLYSNSNWQNFVNSGQFFVKRTPSLRD